MKRTLFCISALAANLAYAGTSNVKTTLKEIYIEGGYVRLELNATTPGPHCAPGGNNKVMFRYDDSSPKQNEAFLSAALTGYTAGKTVIVYYDTVACISGNPELTGLMLRSD